MWKDSPPLTAYFLRRFDPRSTLQNGKDLPGSQHLGVSRPRPARVSPRVKTHRNAGLGRSDPGRGNVQSWGVAVFSEARTPKTLQSEMEPELGGGLGWHGCFPLGPLGTGECPWDSL